MLMLRMILAGKYDFSSPEWEDRSDTVKDLVIRLFNLVNIETIIIFSETASNVSNDFDSLT